jgi:shikimate dehydrogenase
LSIEPALHQDPRSAAGPVSGPVASLAAALAPVPGRALSAALIGRGIGESRTPRMHRAEGARLGLDYGYELVDFDRLGLPDAAVGAAVAEARRLGLAGLNVTHPFKQAVIPLLDAVAPDAAAIGAVNTIVFERGRATGHNTDCFGFAESFRRNMAGAPLGHVVLVGAGGGGMAVGRALTDLGVAELSVFDLDGARATAVAERLGRSDGAGRVRAASDVAAALSSADGLVNSTPMGMAKYPGLPVPATALRPDLWVADIVYFPAETALLATARATGCRVLPGKGMAIFQAVKAFALFTGHEPDAEEMTRHFGAP